MWHCPFNEVELGDTYGKGVEYKVHLTVPILPAVQAKITLTSEKTRGAGGGSSLEVVGAHLFTICSIVHNIHRFESSRMQIILQKHYIRESVVLSLP